MADRRSVVRVQTGVRMEKRILLVLKALAGTLDLSLGDLLEGIVLHAFEGKAPFGAATLAKIRALRPVYGLDLTAEDSHKLTEAAAKGPPPALGQEKARGARTAAATGGPASRKRSRRRR